MNPDIKTAYIRLARKGYPATSGLGSKGKF